MKLLGLNCELVTEFAKRLTWEERYSALNCQTYVHGKQLHYLDNVVGKVDWIVTDSPTLLSAIYVSAVYPKSFVPFVVDVFNRYDNYNFFINRVKSYNPVGRNQTENQAKEIDCKILNFLDETLIPYTRVDGTQLAPKLILSRINL